jgi:hypothetical protein
MGRHRPDISGDGLADQSDAPTIAIAKTLRAEGPPWVLSFMVLARLKALLDRLERRFELTSEVRSVPKGSIDWTQYATRQLPQGNFLSVPCTFPDLRDDRHLKGAIRFAIEKQLRSLESQNAQGALVHRLIALAESLLQTRPTRTTSTSSMRSAASARP